MVGLLLAVVMLSVLVGVCQRNAEPRHVVQLVVGAYALRMILQLFLRDLPVFSYGQGGDWYAYELQAIYINDRIWHFGDVHFVSATELPWLGNASLVVNVYAIITYFNGGEMTRTGCSSVIAACAVLACYQLYRLAVDLGADENKAFRVTAIMLFLPGYLYYTTDMFKDALVAFLVVTAFTASFRLASRVTLTGIIISALSLWALAYVRGYLVFLAVAPLAVGLLGIGRGSVVRQILFGTAFCVCIALAVRFSAFGGVTDQAQQIFEFASNSSTRGYNQRGGSGVAFDDGGQAFGALHLKVLYTLFSPFPWQGGSVAMQMGKIDTLFIYYLFWRVLIVARRLWREDRSLLFMFLVLLVPLTVAYATTMANIGLILRQRFPIVLVGAALAMLSWPRRSVVQPAPPQHRFASPRLAGGR